MGNDKDEVVSVRSPSAFFVQESKKLEGQLHFWTREDWQGEVPHDQADLQIEFDDACAVIRARFANLPKQQRTEFLRLLELATATFGGDTAHVARGRKSLNAYKQELLKQEGPAIKNAYLKELAWASLFASLLIVAVAAALRYGIVQGEKLGVVTPVRTEQGDLTQALSSLKWDSRFSPLHFGFLLASTMWGIWLSFVVRNMELRFEQLQHPESDLMRPWSRLLAFGILAFVMALFFQMQVVVVSIGDVFSTSQISNNLLVSMFVGFGLGFLDKTLPSEVRRRFEELFSQARTPQ